MSKLIVVSQVYHQMADRQPTGFPVRFSRELGNDEQPFLRELVAGEEWRPLECGWVSGAAGVAIENIEGRFTQRVPEPEVVAEAKRRVIEVSSGGDPLRVRPGEGQVLLVSDIAKWRVRCVCGEARFNLMVIQSG